MSETLGSVYHLGQGHFEWAIDDYLSFRDIRSPTFKFNGSSFGLGVSAYDDDDRIQLKVSNKSVSPCKFHVKLEMGTGYRGKRESRRGITDERGTFCVRRWMPLVEFNRRRLEILPNGRLKVTCKLQEYSNTVPVPNKQLASEESEFFDDEYGNTSESEREGSDEEKSESDGRDSDEEKSESDGRDFDEEKSESDGRDSDEDEAIPQPKSFKKMQEALKNLLMSGEDSDVTIKVQGKEFPAHRNILRARSSVFKSMFTHDMVEKESGLVLIDDSDPTTFLDFLNHLYTGSTEHISVENVFSLYTAADKYDMEDLKEECLAFMENNLNIDTFCDTIALALKHSETELVQLATKFFCRNTSEIVETTKWQTFLKEQATVGNELFIKALANKEVV